MPYINKVKTAVIGCGMISDIYLANMLSKFSIFELAGCCNRTQSKAREKAEKYGISVLGYDEIRNDESIEMVVNLTQPDVHFSVINDMLGAGKHVYTEKVLAVRYEDAKTLAEMAETKKLYLGAAPDTFLGAGIQTARQIADSGLIGEITSCYAVLNRDNGYLSDYIPFLNQPGGGIGFDVGIYYITSLLSILGPVKEVSGFVRTNRPLRKHMLVGSPSYGELYELINETVMAGTLVFVSGAVGSVHFNSDSVFEEQPQLVLMGTEGILYLPDPNQFGGEVRLIRRGQAQPCIIPHNFGYSENSRGLGAAEMAWALRGGRPPRASKEMALHALEVLHGIVQSSHTGTSYIMKTSFNKPLMLPQGYIDRYGNAEAALTI